MNMLLESVEKNDRPDLNEAKRLVRDIYEFIEADGSALLPLMKIREYDDYTYTHSVNVGILTMMMAGKYGFDGGMVHEMGLGALLHDTGKLTISRDLLNKQGKLSGDEINVFRQHPGKGYEYMAQFRDVSAEVLAIIHQHHEWYNGKGYPRGLNDETMHAGAKFAAICDVYDALTTARSYKRAYSTSEALALIIRGSGSHFSPVLVSRFVHDMTPLLQKHPVFSPGTLVLLNTGEVAMVKEAHSIGDDKPVVTIVTDNQRKRLNRAFNIDLTMDATRNLVKVIRFADVPPE
jgi:putative nucleotidyltransferase with HDIG domain